MQGIDFEGSIPLRGLPPRRAYCNGEKRLQVIFKLRPFASSFYFFFKGISEPAKAGLP